MTWMFRMGLALLCWTCLVVVNAATPQTSPPAWQQMQTQLDAQQKAADALQADNKALLERLKAQELVLLETQRKSVDWWLSAIGVGLTLLGLVVAVGGVLIPLYWQRSERSRLKEAQAEFERMKQEAGQALCNLQSHEQVGKKHMESLEAAQRIASAFQSGPEREGTADVANTEMQGAVQALAESSPIDQLRARAIQASQVKQPTDEQALFAYELWNALTIVAPTDRNAQFNAGYWAQQIFKRSEGARRTHWLEVLNRHYKPLSTSYAALFNWGNALTVEAQEVAKTDLSEARKLWAQAGEKYAQALGIKADKHEAANNWGSALADEAQEVAKTDLSEARKLWAQAAEKYAQALGIKADTHETANNWGSALADEAQEVAKTDLSEARKLWAQAGEKYAQALGIKADKHEAANNWGNALANEAQEVAKTDLSEARKLWAQAAAKYAQALGIKADMHEAANNWGSALANEAKEVAKTDLPEARKLWAQAAEKYAQALGIKADTHEAANNWGNALADEATAVALTDLVAARALWKQAGEKYEQALRVAADLHEVVSNWAAAYSHESHALREAQQVDEAKSLLQKAHALMEQHIAHYPEAAPVMSYNLACAYGIQGRAEDAVKQLELARGNNKLPGHWREDKDLAPIRQTTEYLSWVQTHFS